MKICKIIFLFLICSLSAQKNLAFDSLKLKEVRDLFADDYGNIYLYKNKDFSFTKYDSLGNQKGKLMLTLPFKIQSVQNPLNIPSFSENAQELKFFDQNLNEIQTVNFRQKFGFIRMVYAEDLQQLWLLDESMKRLIQYNFRDNKIVNSFPFDINFEDLTDFLVFESKVYFLGRNQFSVYNFKAEKIIELPFKNGRRLRRENQNILIMSENSVQKFEDLTLKTIFSSQNSQIVDKNSAAYFVIKDNKLYLYKP
ncbi:hypothetical protein IV494_05120 [Kaistella sp. G5-32]|uniref:WG repeat protein n=1 Tax=Kaistella gelatinilytica TaxID=2787636 RepID=A0ABS0FA59_9FLAO|nr:hypothetical protein [Kaistella gelatinilytica]MBF8456557.1 hypothetical protein [Kaistella gelatinilytica]